MKKLTTIQIYEEDLAKLNAIFNGKKNRDKFKMLLEVQTKNTYNDQYNNQLDMLYNKIVDYNVITSEKLSNIIKAIKN